MASDTVDTRFVGLLRGINVGGASRVSMPELRNIVTELGLADVSTYINSGNVLFTSPAPADESDLAQCLTDALTDRFGWQLMVTVRSRARVAELMAALPSGWANDASHRCDVVFLFPEVAGPDALDHFTVREGVDEVILAGDAICWRVARADQQRSGLRDILGTPVYRQVTVRNVNTTRKLAGLL